MRLNARREMGDAPSHRLEICGPVMLFSSKRREISFYSFQDGLCI
jgi:hypothetical protein